MSRAARTVSTSLLVCAGCYVGATIGTTLRFPQVGSAILFPSYAVLTAALLLSPPRTWWLYLLAAAAGDFWPHRASGAPTSFVVLAEAANWIRALVVAVGVRRFGDRSARFDTLRGMAVLLLFAVVLGPLAAAFVGAGVVAWHEGADRYWLAWQAWLLSNALTGLTLLPIILLTIANAGARMRRVSPARLLEAGAVLLALVLVGRYIFIGSYVGSSSLTARLYVPLPLLLWAAVRFGPGGTSATVLVMAIVTVWGALGGRGPFVTESPAENLLHLQLFLIALSVPPLLLSVLLQEQRETAAALHESREHYRSVVEDQTELICRFLPDGTLTFVNGAYCRYFQRSPEELVGRPFWPLIAPEEQAQARRFFASITAERPVATIEHEVLAPGGKMRWQQWTDRGFFDAHGRIVGFQAVGRDITERRRAEEEHRLLLAQREVADALREADRRKDEFLAMLAHELRNPLSPIGMATEILRRLPVADDRIQWARDVIGRQVSHLTRLVDDLLDISRITRGKITLQMEPLELERAIAQAVETSLPLLTARQHLFTTSVPPGLRVRGDPVRLAQLVSNLLNNAAKYTPAGGRIALTARREVGQIVVTVVDNGVGIPPEMLERVFDLFVQVDSLQDRATGSLGLGLTLVKRLVEMHGGTVAASSAGPGRGSEFVVRLPALAADASASSYSVTESDPRAPGAGTPTRRILIVDDIVDAAEGLARMLKLDGHEVRVAHDGLAALEAAERLHPEVVLLDISLPKVDGLEVARRLRTRFGADAMLVATTGLGQDDDRRRTSEAGFDHHLVKPIDPGTLRALLATGRPSGAFGRAITFGAPLRTRLGTSRGKSGA